MRPYLRKSEVRNELLIPTLEIRLLKSEYINDYKTTQLTNDNLPIAKIDWEWLEQV